jgi:hypothetical protein
MKGHALQDQDDMIVDDFDVVDGKVILHGHGSPIRHGRSVRNWRHGANAVSPAPTIYFFFA